MKPKVSMIVPTRNEEQYIDKTISSLLKQDYPKEYLEILFVDGMSSDRTREIITDYAGKFGFIKLLDNPKIFVPYAFNIGIKHASGEIVVTLGAHTNYSSNYISTIVKYLSENQAECVGSVAQTLPGDDTVIARSIALALSSPFGVGNSYMRTGSQSAQYVDTASCPGYKKEIFDTIGLFNEELAHSQDMELNLRLRKAGGRILLVPSLTSYYFARSDFKSFSKHNFRNGLWVVLPFKYAKIIPVSWRHMVPLAFLSSLIFFSILSVLSPVFMWVLLSILGAYFLVNLFFSLNIALYQVKLRYLFTMPVIFTALHVGYGLGSLWGVIKLLLPEKKKKV